MKTLERPGTIRMSADRPGLTAAQARILGMFEDAYATRRPAPTIRNIRDEIGVSSPNGVVCHIKSLEKKGWIVRPPIGSCLSRYIRLTPKAIAHIDPSYLLDVASLTVDQATILRDTLDAHLVALSRKGA